MESTPHLDEPADNADKLARRRRSGGSMQVGLASEGNIKQIFKIGDERLFMIKEHATYEIRLADTIDPERTNESIPNVQQRVFSAGASSNLIQGILLTSETLFNRSFLADFDCDGALMHSFNAMGEVMAMDRIFERMRNEENRLIEELQGQKLENGFIVPTLDDASQDVKNFIQRADHFVREINYITRIFERNFGNWDGLIRKYEKKILSISNL